MATNKFRESMIKFANGIMIALVFTVASAPVVPVAPIAYPSAPSYTDNLKEVFECHDGAYTSAVVIPHGSDTPVVVNATPAFEDWMEGNDDNFKHVIAFCDVPADGGLQS